VGPARARALAEAGLVTVLDLLRHVPSRWEDRREVSPVNAALAPDTDRAFTFRGRLSEVRRIRTRRRGFSLVRAVLTDGSGAIPVVWFNQPYLFQQLRDGEEYLLHGAVREAPADGRELLNPTCEAVDRALHSARIAPVYSSVGSGKGSLGPAVLRRLLDAVLADFDPASIPEPLPDELRVSRGLPSLGAALLSLHRPESVPEPDVAALNERRSPAHRRLAYEELLRMQVTVGLLRARETAAPRSLIYRVDDRLRGVVRGLLPFRLTAAQKRVLGEIVADLRGPHPMLRLLQGDVGSGKTLVAALALAVALESGFQGAFMAPTELLAEQHFATLERLLGSRYRLGLFVGGKGGRKSDPRLRERLAAGEIQLAVGTHALIQEGVVFRRLGLAVVDEQHRFGVRQRALLRGKGLRGKGDQEEQPDLLVMTATPIPRTLALTAWGDLEASTLDELPPGRSPVVTEVVPAGKRRAVYKKVRDELAAGGRVYVVVPLIDESARTAAASLAEAEERVRAELAGWPCAVLHGRLPAAERDRVMKAFAAGEVKVLLATTVIEVGVDVPEASCMVIESAERFGLAQLHQLRGRVGRGARPSCCFAVHCRLSDLSEEGKRRLEVFARTNDGFEIAEEDLKIRGPGDVLGTRQAGLPGLRWARLPDDWELLEQARDDARELLGRLGEEALEGLRKTADVGGAGWAE